MGRSYRRVLVIANLRVTRADEVLDQPIPIFTVIIVAVAAGALYYRHKD